VSTLKDAAQTPKNSLVTRVPSASLATAAALLTQDICDGTMTMATQGAVDLTNLGTERTMTVKAGRSFFVLHKR